MAQDEERLVKEVFKITLSSSEAGKYTYLQALDTKLSAIRNTINQFAFNFGNNTATQQPANNNNNSNPQKLDRTLLPGTQLLSPTSLAYLQFM
jgi:hypothetical protein